MLLRYRLGVVAALAAYLVVNVGAGALHHHHRAECRPGGSPTVPATKLQFENADRNDDDGEEHCLLCSVLHLARILPTPCHLENVAILTDKAFPTAAITRLCALETAVHARAPPAP